MHTVPLESPTKAVALYTGFSRRIEGGARGGIPRVVSRPASPLCIHPVFPRPQVMHTHGLLRWLARCFVGGHWAEAQS